MRNQLVAAVTAAVMGLSGPVVAKVSPAEAERLNNELTPVGAERAGNAEGTIPAWNGGLGRAWRDYLHPLFSFGPHPITRNMKHDESLPDEAVTPLAVGTL